MGWHSKALRSRFTDVCRSLPAAGNKLQAAQFIFLCQAVHSHCKYLRENISLVRRRPPRRRGSSEGREQRMSEWQCNSCVVPLHVASLTCPPTIPHQRLHSAQTCLTLHSPLLIRRFSTCSFTTLTFTMCSNLRHSIGHLCPLLHPM